MGKKERPGHNEMGEGCRMFSTSVERQPVSIKCRLQFADCRLQTGYKMQTADWV